MATEDRNYNRFQNQTPPPPGPGPNHPGGLLLKELLQNVAVGKVSVDEAHQLIEAGKITNVKFNPRTPLEGPGPDHPGSGR